MQAAQAEYYTRHPLACRACGGSGVSAVSKEDIVSCASCEGATPPTCAVCAEPLGNGDPLTRVCGCDYDDVVDDDETCYECLYNNPE